MARSRLLLRVEHPDGARLYWSPHHLSGYGTTPEAARADFDRRLRELAEDGLEIVGTHEAQLSGSRPHSAESMGTDRPADAYHYGYGPVSLRVVRKR